MDQNAKHNAHCVNCVSQLPLVWIPRYRKKVLVEPIATRLNQWFREIAAQDGFEIVADDALRVPDHVHLFASAPPQFAPAQVVRLFKGITSRRLTQEFAQIRRAYWGPNATLWAEGYSRASINRCSATSQ